MDFDWNNILGSTAPQGIAGGVFGQLVPQGGAMPAPTGSYGAQPNTFGVNAPDTTNYALPPQAQPKPPGGGFFGAEGPGRAMAGYLGDYLLQRAHMQPIYAPMQAERMKQGNALQQAMAVQQLKNAKPQNPTPFIQDYQYLLQTNPALAATFMQQHANPQIPVTNPANGAIVPMAKGAPPPPAPPTPGTVQDGYVFLGGDPAQQSSWRKQ